MARIVRPQLGAISPGRGTKKPPLSGREKGALTSRCCRPGGGTAAPLAPGARPKRGHGARGRGWEGLVLSALLR